MFKIEINKFTTAVAGKPLFLTVPTSLYAALSESKNIVNPYYRDEADARLSILKSSYEISASFNLSSDAAKLKHAYLRIPNLDTEAEVVFNGHTVLLASDKSGYDIDVSGLAVSGANKLLIKVPESESVRDVTFFESTVFCAFANAVIASVAAKPVFEEDGSVSVYVSAEMLGESDDIKAVATLVSPSGKIYYGGVTNGKTVIKVPDPLLWWPRDYGIQNVYKLGVNIYYENEFVDSLDSTVGFCSAQVDEREGIAYTLGRVKFFAKGVEYRADGDLAAFLMHSRASMLVPSSAAANVNFIRFSGIGRYPTDEFLTLCDTYGIALECVLDEKTLLSKDPAALKRELAYNFRRMSAHPSVLAVSCNTAVLGDDLCRALTDARDEAFSSIIIRTSSGGEVEQTVVSLPSSKTLAAVCEKDDLNVFSRVMQYHVASSDETVALLSKAAQSYRYADGIDELAYMSGILSGHENERISDKKRSGREAYGSVVIRSLNDSYPSVSFALVDFNGRFKSSYYLAKRFFAPVRLFVTHTDAGVIFHLSNETQKDFAGVIEYSVKDSSNKSVYKANLEITADKLTSVRLPAVDLSEYFAQNEREYYLEYSLLGERGKISSAAYLFTSPSAFNFKKPTVLSEISGSGREFVLTCTSNVFAKDVVFGFKTIDAVFDENCIDLTDDSVKRITFVTSETVSVEKLLSELRTTSVYNIGRK